MSEALRDTKQRFALRLGDILWGAALVDAPHGKNVVFLSEIFDQ